MPALFQPSLFPLGLQLVCISITLGRKGGPSFFPPHLPEFPCVGVSGPLICSLTNIPGCSPGSDSQLRTSCAPPHCGAGPATLLTAQLRELTPTKSSHLPKITQLIRRAWIQTHVSNRQKMLTSYVKAPSKGLGLLKSQVKVMFLL